MTARMMANPQMMTVQGRPVAMNQNWSIIHWTSKSAKEKRTTTIRAITAQTRPSFTLNGMLALHCSNRSLIVARRC